MTVTLYQAIDGFSPILNGQYGSLANVLQTCLITGYGDKPGAGWDLPFFDGVTKLVLRPALGTRMFLEIDDNLTGFSHTARLRAWETATAFGAGTDKFPLIGPIQLLKSVSTDALARDWKLLTNGKIIYFFSNWNNQVEFGQATSFAFGDFDSFDPTDTKNCLIAGKITANTYIDAQLNPFGKNCAMPGGIDGIYSARSFTGMGRSIRLGKHGDHSKDGCLFPNPVDGGLYYSPIWVTEENAIKGKLPGIWHVPHSADYLNHGDTFSDSSGRTFMICKSYQSVVALEISNTW